MTGTSLTASILQLALLILNAVNNNPNLPPAVASQAASIAQQASQFANQNSAYFTNTASTPQCYAYSSTGCTSYYAQPVAYNYSPVVSPYAPQNYYSPYPPPYLPASYNPYYPSNPYGYYSSPGATQIMVVNAVGMDSGAVQNGSTYNIIWTPYDSSQGPATVQLYSYPTSNTSFIASAQSNVTPWVVNSTPGSYQLRVLQNGAVLASRNISVQ